MTDNGKTVELSVAEYQAMLSGITDLFNGKPVREVIKWEGPREVYLGSA
jgi:hypothetical protein